MNESRLVRIEERLLIVSVFKVLPRWQYLTHQSALRGSGRNIISEDEAKCKGMEVPNLAICPESMQTKDMHCDGYNALYKMIRRGQS